MIKFFQKRMNKKGFTLVELLIVIAVLGIIAGIAVPSMSGVTDTFKRKADIETARIAVRQVEVMAMAGLWADGNTFEAAELSTNDSTDGKTNLKYGDALPTSQLNDDGTMTIKVEADGTTGNWKVTVSQGTATFIKDEIIQGVIE